MLLSNGTVTNVSAQEDGLCEHHLVHDDDCGYIEATEEDEGHSCEFVCDICNAEVVADEEENPAEEAVVEEVANDETTEVATVSNDNIADELVAKVYSEVAPVNEEGVAPIALPTDNPLSRDSIVEDLGISKYFAVFAINFENSMHMEGTVAVKNLTYSNSVIGTSDRVIEANKMPFDLTIEKTATGEKSKNQTYKFRVYKKDDANFCEEIEITTGSNGKGSKTLYGLSDGTYYVYEVDDNGNNIEYTKDDWGNVQTGPIEAKVNGQDVKVTYKSSDPTQSGPDTSIVGGLGNTSYIENFLDGENQGRNFGEIAQGPGGYGNSTSKSMFVIGKNNTVTESADRYTITGPEPSGTYEVVKSKGGIEQVTGEFPINFENELKKLKELSVKLAQGSGSSDVTVVWLDANGGSIDTSNVYVDDGSGPVIPDMSDSAWWQNKGFEVPDDKFIVFNVDCTGASSVTFRAPAINGQEFTYPNNETLAPTAKRIIWNFYTNNNGVIAPYEGEVNADFAGTLLAPSATVDNSNATVCGSVIGETVRHTHGEIHQMQIVEYGPMQILKVFNEAEGVSVDEFGSLTIKKNVKVNGEETDTQLADGTYTFKVTGPGGYSETVTITIENGVSNSVTLDDLEPGTYTIEEINIPEGMTIIGENPLTIDVEANNTASIPVAEFTNNKTVVEKVYGSLEITKNVTVNGKATTGTLADGTYTFEVTGNGKTETVTITIKDGKSSTATVKDLEPGTYTVKEVNVPEGMTVVGENPITVEVEANNTANIPVAEFTNDKVILGSLTIQKTSIGRATPANTIFTITGPNGYTKTVKYSQFKDGKYTLTGLELGEYTVVETGANVKDYGLIVDGNGTAELTVESPNVSVEFINRYSQKTTSLIIIKIDQDFNLLEGATFRLYKIVDGKETLVDEISGGPKFEFTGLLDGYYRVEEDAPVGYAGIGSFDVEIIDGKVYYVDGEDRYQYDVMDVMNTNDGTEPGVLGDQVEYNETDDIEVNRAGDQKETTTTNTGDDTNITGYVAATTGSFLLGVYLFLRRKEEM